MKEAVMKVIDTLTQKDFNGAFQKLSEWYNKCIASGGDYFKGDYSFMCVLSIKVHIWKKSGNLFNDLHTYKNIILYFYSSTVTLMWNRRVIRESLHAQISCWELEQPAETNFSQNSKPYVILKLPHDLPTMPVFYICHGLHQTPCLFSGNHLVDFIYGWMYLSLQANVICYICSRMKTCVSCNETLLFSCSCFPQMLLS